MLSNRSALFVAAALIATSACKDDDSSKVCTIGDNSTCSSEQVCEQVQGGDPTCFDPVYVRGQVFDAQTSSAIANASVIAVDVSGGVVASAVLTDASGNYSLNVPATRDADGNVLAFSVTLRVDASGYLAFPKAPRIALPIDLMSGVAANNEIVVDNITTDVSLFKLSATDLGSIHGTVSADLAGALVVADQGGTAVSTAIVNFDGTFTLFNVPINVSTTVSAYIAGFHVVPETVTVVSTTTALDVDLVSDTTGLATVSGNLSPVSGPVWTNTSVILVVESTFSSLLNAGYVPAGLRDGTLTPSDTAFSIVDVPPGRYVLLAAFENDGLVRDPDLGQAGTDIRSVQVSDSGVVTVTSPRSEDLSGIKVTGPITIVSPGATSAVEIVTTVPQLRWAPYPGTNHYEVRVFDAFGTKVYEDITVPSTGNPVTVTMDGTHSIPVAASASLTPGMVYQFHVVGIKTGGDANSLTEDLLGVFQYQP